MERQTLLKVTDLSKSFGKASVLMNIDLDIRAGEIVFIIGPSGAGKSTLLRCLNLLEMPSAGSIEFDGQTLCSGSGPGFGCASRATVRAARARMPMVFQHFNLFKHRTALENVIEGPVRVLGHGRAQASQAGREILESVGLGAKFDAYPAELSGGQQQRVGIARALAMQPVMVLFDEPTSALDAEFVSGILETIRRLAADGMTMIIVTHELKFARNLADRIIFMAEGRILDSGTAEEMFDRPRHERVRAFMQQLHA
jgi:ABC-type polar amino acid transport system ATPase subunit